MLVLSICSGRHSEVGVGVSGIVSVGDGASVACGVSVGVAVTMTVMGVGWAQATEDRMIMTVSQIRIGVRSIRVISYPIVVHTPTWYSLCEIVQATHYCGPACGG